MLKKKGEVDSRKISVNKADAEKTCQETGFVVGKYVDQDITSEPLSGI